MPNDLPGLCTKCHHPAHTVGNCAERYDPDGHGMMRCDCLYEMPNDLPTPRAKLSEKQVTEQICGWMELRGWYGIRLQSGLFRTKDGRYIRVGKKSISDWIFLRDAEYLLVEMKATGKKPSAAQMEWDADCKRAGRPRIWADGLKAFKFKYGLELVK